MNSSNNVPVNDLINQIGKGLKSVEEITPPIWTDFVKTGANRERPPANKDWWYIRVAAVLRSVSNLGPIGVSKLRTKYGGKKNRGHKPERFYKGSGTILRKCLQQLELAGFVKKAEIGVHKGRQITPKGQKFINEQAKLLSKGS